MDPPVEPDRRPDTVVRIVTLICLTALVFASIIGITIVSVFTDRDVHYAEGLSFGGAVLVAVIGGFSLAGLRRKRRHHWRIEHDDNGNAE